MFTFGWLKMFLGGILIGAILMIAPSLVLFLLGSVSWKVNIPGLLPLLSGTMLFVAVAVAEEVLFRGFIFRRIMDALGEWPAQLIIAAYFLLIHFNNPGMTGSTKVIASINIFLASVMFGLALIRTKSLAMPIGIHFMANWMQGVILGFGVSGSEQASLLQPVFNVDSDLLTGGTFGLEASIPGLISVIITIILLYKWKPVIIERNSQTFTIAT
jgi:membrane protease YdiL (CAAX protease family)